MDHHHHHECDHEVRQHFSHQHHLTRFNHPLQTTTKHGHGKEDLPKLNCYGCHRHIEADANANAITNGDGNSYCYGCKDCDVFLHKSCLNLPLEYDSPCHPPHPLTLRFSGGQHFCLICCSPIPGFAYGCSHCDFYVDIPCHSYAYSNEVTARKLQDGGHLFFLWETEPGTQYCCDICGEFDFDTHLFKCMIPSCPRSFHFRCAPFSLPKTAKHEWDIHLLTLTAKFGEEGLEKYYCDACEAERHLNHPVYACQECGFSAHISCAIFEVLPSIIEEYEKGSKSRGISTHDITLGTLNTKIQEIIWEEDRLKHELNRVTAQIKQMEEVRAQYVAWKTSPLTIKELLQEG